MIVHDPKERYSDEYMWEFLLNAPKEYLEASKIARQLRPQCSTRREDGMVEFDEVKMTRLLKDAGVKLDDLFRYPREFKANKQDNVNP